MILFLTVNFASTMFEKNLENRSCPYRGLSSKMKTAETGTENYINLHNTGKGSHTENPKRRISEKNNDTL